MDMSDLYRRYDGPVPSWEIPPTASPLRPRQLLFHRNRAIAAVKALRLELQRACATTQSARLHHWHSAVRLLFRYRDERQSHRAVVKALGC